MWQIIGHKQKGKLMETILSDVTHAKNIDLWLECARLAEKLGYRIRHNASGKGGFDGYHRYVILKPDFVDYSIRSTHCIFWCETRYSRYYKPSISGETLCIKEMIAWLKERMKSAKYMEGDRFYDPRTGWSGILTAQKYHQTIVWMMLHDNGEIEELTVSDFKRIKIIKEN